MVADMDDEDLLGLVALWHDMKPRERRVFAAIGVRLLAGQVQYGPLTPRKKRWRKEAQEEAMDMAVYLAAELEDTLDDEEPK
jgi:type II secretory pathway component PulM